MMRNTDNSAKLDKLIKCEFVVKEEENYCVEDLSETNQNVNVLNETQKENGGRNEMDGKDSGKEDKNEAGEDEDENEDADGNDENEKSVSCESLSWDKSVFRNSSFESANELRNAKKDKSGANKGNRNDFETTNSKSQEKNLLENNWSSENRKRNRRKRKNPKWDGNLNFNGVRSAKSAAGFNGANDNNFANRNFTSSAAAAAAAPIRTSAGTAATVGGRRLVYRETAEAGNDRNGSSMQRERRNASEEFLNDRKFRTRQYRKTSPGYNPLPRSLNNHSPRKYDQHCKPRDRSLGHNVSERSHFYNENRRNDSNIEILRVAEMDNGIDFPNRAQTRNAFPYGPIKQNNNSDCYRGRRAREETSKDLRKPLSDLIRADQQRKAQRQSHLIDTINHNNDIYHNSQPHPRDIHRNHFNHYTHYHDDNNINHNSNNHSDLLKHRYSNNSLHKLNSPDNLPTLPSSPLENNKIMSLLNNHNSLINNDCHRVKNLMSVINVLLAEVRNAPCDCTHHSREDNVNRSSKDPCFTCQPTRRIESVVQNENENFYGSSREVKRRQFSPERSSKRSLEYLPTNMETNCCPSSPPRNSKYRRLATPRNRLSEPQRRNCFSNASF